MDTQDGDERATELETLEAIYPEIQYPDRAREPFTFEIELPIQPEAPVTVIFPTSAVGNDVAVGGAGGAAAAGGVGAVDGDNDSLNVSHLPSLRLRMTLPEGYPTDRPPVVHLSSDPQWLPAGTVSRLEADVVGLWEDVGRDMVAFAYIDHLRRAADDVFDAITPQGTLEVDAQHKLSVLDYDIKAKKEAFEKETFECGVCLDPKKGSKCHKMLDCAHIFCLQCLQDFYNDAITEGNISVVRCLAPNCAKERADAMAKVGKRSRKPNTAVSPSELLLIGVAEDTVKRYVALKYKTELESDKNTIYCPRQWCSGAARSKKHKKPSGLDFAGHGEGDGSGSDSSDDESLVGEGDDNDEKREERAKKKKKKKKAKARFNRADLLAVCEDCGFAFCSQCLLSWHGEFVICTPKRDVTELTEEEKASLEYVKLHTSPCPTCNAPAQKTQGCNHMICSRCESHFCYLCSAWLDPNNPYQHYNSAPGGKVTSCYMRLWELEGGDGNDVGLGFVGGGGPPGPAAAAAAAPMFDVEDAEAQVAALGAFGDSDTEDDEPRDQQQPQPAANDGPAVLAREGPLVLRLMGGGGQQQQQQQQQPAANAAPRRQGAAAAAGRGQANAQRGGAAAAARGRGRGRGGGRDGQAGAAQAPARGGGGGHGRGDAQQRNNNVANPARGRRRAAGAAPAPAPAPAEGQEGAQANADGNGNIGLDAVQEAWVRNFVRMALIDAEDELGDSSDDDGDGIAFFAIR